MRPAHGLAHFFPLPPERFTVDGASRDAGRRGRGAHGQFEQLVPGLSQGQLHSSSHRGSQSLHLRIEPGLAT